MANRVNELAQRIYIDMVSRIALAPGRTIWLGGVAPSSAPALLVEAEAAGFVTRSDDPRLRLQACAGRPSCAHGNADVRAGARRLSHLAPPGGLHVSGCAKGCAHPRASDITLVGTPGGLDLVRNGSPRDVPIRRGLTIADVRAVVGAR